MRIFAISDIHREHYRHSGYTIGWDKASLLRRNRRIEISSDLGFDADSVITGGFMIDAADADVIILAGDIDKGTSGVEWAIVESIAENKPVIYVPGNHEYYGHTPDIVDEMKHLAAKHEAPVYVLDCDMVEIGGVRILGATLWSSLTAGGDDEFTRHAIQSLIMDYRAIHNHHGGAITIDDTLTWHRDAVAWLKYCIARPFGGKTLVVTHHSPSLRSVHPAFGLNATSGAFMSDLEELTAGVDIWIHGHTHSCLDTILPTGCRLFSNQLGYPHERTPGRMPHRIIAT